ncbi:MAG: penicillin-binding protein activator [Mariprofundaceae bacterium]|nr:penicillin-binding protein activator [Mariprofundaceae bacterium]
MLCLGLVLLAACAPKTAVQTDGGIAGGKIQAAKTAKQPPTSPAITAMMRLAFDEGRIDEALQGLDRLIEIGRPPDLEEALFRRIQILLFVGDARAVPQANALLRAYPDHPLVAYLHIWLMQWAEARQLDAKVLKHATAVLENRSASAALRQRAATHGAAAARRSPDWEAVQWFLHVARLLADKRDIWLREASSRASMAMIGRLRDGGELTGDIGKSLILHTARGRLMIGDMASVQTLAAWLQQSFPGSAAARLSKSWAAGVTHAANIGVMLPLSGEYAQFGRQALHGVRLAIDGLEDNQQITLHIVDTSADTAANALAGTLNDPKQAARACLQAYRSLIDQHVDMIIGPLLGDCAKLLAGHMRGKIPVISLTSHSLLAKKSPLLFVHTLSPILQARFMADYAASQGDRRIVVVSTDAPSSSAEAAAFADEFTALGGEVADRMVLQHGSIDFRDALRGMRMRTDDALLLAELDEDLALSVQPEEDMEIRMPVNFDGVFLALSGRQVALLSGQLAYVGVKNIHLFGSSRWQDGYLLSDKGRYLRQARFSDVAFPNGSSPELRRFKLAWRDVWGLEKPEKLAGLAYDSMLIAVLLTHRMGLSGQPLLAALKDKAGFPGLTGHVYFSPGGVGQKDFEMFRIRRHEIVPAG